MNRFLDFISKEQMGLEKEIRALDISARTVRGKGRKDILTRINLGEKSEYLGNLEMNPGCCEMAVRAYFSAGKIAFKIKDFETARNCFLSSLGCWKDVERLEKFWKMDLENFDYGLLGKNLKKFIDASRYNQYLYEKSERIGLIKRSCVRLKREACFPEEDFVFTQY